MKNKSIFFTFCIILSSLICTNCTRVDNSFTKQAYANSGIPREGYVKINYDSASMTIPSSEIKKQLVPIYKTETPEEINASPEKINNSSVASGSNKTESVIPGLRDLKDYKTLYSTKRLPIPKATERVVSEEFISTTTNENGEEVPDTNFYIEDWGPYSTVVSENRFPTFYVVFSQPVKAITSLEETSSTSKIMTINPPLKGTFHWYGSQQLAFEAEESPNPSIQYTMTIDPNLKSISGIKIQGQTTFVTKAEPLDIVSSYYGYSGPNSYNYSYAGATPPYENVFYIRLNYKVSSKELKDALVVKVGSKEVRYTLKQDFDSSNFPYSFTPLFDKENKLTNSYIVTIRDEVPHNTTIYYSLNGENCTRTIHSYITLQPFSLYNFEKTARKNYNTGKSSIELRFTQPVDKNSLFNNISFDIPNYKLKLDDISAGGQYVTINNLPLDYDTDYTLKIKNQTLDIYGQTLSLNNDSESFTFHLPSYNGYVRYLDQGIRILEAQYPHKLLYEYMNANGYYTLSKTSNPLNTYYDYNNSENTYFDSSYNTKIIRTDINSGSKNRRYFQEVNLDPFLDNGYGFVRFSDSTWYNYYDYYYGETRETKSSSHLTVQVTDLGVTARYAVNKAVVMVSKLSTGKVVPNATVKICCANSIDNIENNIFATGTTDENGLCVINYTESEIDEYLSLLNNHSEYYTPFYFVLYVENGKDKVMFEPSSHSSWQYGVSTSSQRYVNKSKQKTFMFVDRGLYRPGEIVTLRIIDRDQSLGILTPHVGSFTINVAGNWYDSTDIINTIYGNTTENGGAYTEFKIPDNTEPGSYSIKFKRSTESDYSQYITFQVANFERVRTQASFSSPDTKLFAGDTISTSLNASYLAGGALSNAQYSVAWYNSQSAFRPKTAETKGYTFGSNQYYSDLSYWSGTDGELDTSGSVVLDCSTKPNQYGDPYIYKADANVVDVSNQMISSSTSFVVHPASFYVGLKNADGKSGYPKINTPLNFNYILVDTDGNTLNEQQIKENVNNLDYSISITKWNVVHGQSVDDTVYSYYEEVEENVKSGKLSPSENKFSFKPTESGWYTVRIYGEDYLRRDVTTKYSFYVTGGTSYWYDRYNSQSINITPDQSEYNPGDTAQLLLESSLPKGDYLITVERDGIFTEEIKHFDSPSNVIEVKIASNYVPVVYVSVCSYSVRNGKPTHEYGETDLDKPKGYYGVAPLFVNPYVRAFSVKVESDKNIYKPGDEAHITLTATKGGKPVEGAELTAMAVDRGVLDLIDYHVPNPISFFYNRNNYPLSVYGGDSRALIMDPVTYSIKNLQGGDAEGLKENERKDFRPTAFFEPSLITDKDGKVSFTFKMPDTLTTYRFTAFGVKDDLFALQEKEMQVQNPINIQQIQPRKLRERDTAECGVLITNFQDEPLKVTVSLEAKTPTEDTEQDKLEGRKTVPGSAFVDGPTKHTVNIAPGDSTVVYFDVAAVTSGTVNLTYSIKSSALNEKLISPIKIEKTYVYETVTGMGQTTDAKKTKQVEELAIPGFAKDGRGDLKFTIDPTRLGLLGSSVNYLFEYPYGCMEQQSARVLPLIIFGDYIDIFGLNSQVYDVKKCVTGFTKSWEKIQHRNGGFPYWPNNTRDENFYVSTRIAHIYSVGKERGYSEKDLGININKLVEYLNKNINRKNYSNYEKLYCCYVLKSLGYSTCDSMLESFYKNRKNLTISEEALLALAYSFGKSSNDQKITKEISDSLRSYVQPAERSVTVINKFTDYRWSWYNTDTDELALLLKLFVTNNKNDKMVDKILFTLLQKQRQGYWNSTSTTTQVLDSIYTYIKARDLDNTNYEATVSINGNKIMSSTFKGVNSKPKTLELPFEDDFFKNIPKDKIVPVTFEKNGDGYLFYTFEMKYALPDEMQNYKNEGINIEYTITDYYTGEIINYSDSNTDDNDSSLFLESGKLYKATIRVESKKDRTYLALRCPVPSGAEIIDSQFITINPSVNDEDYYDEDYYGEDYYYDSYYWNFDNKDILDNEVQYFWDNFYGSKTVSFTFRATRRGVYPTPPVLSECMYEPEVFGRSDGYLVQIK